ncbi:MAG: hypothetical protein C0392_09985 [Syntrophus sp. (in: bacteria)]|nr:hypothetical protein [Syntrophus sp. (in: bacteria)]
MISKKSLSKLLKHMTTLRSLIKSFGGILSIITPINLIILGHWAFSDKKHKAIPKKKAKK